MSNPAHHFTVGDFSCRILSEGYLRLEPAKIFFRGSTEEERNVVLAEHHLQADGIALPISCLMIEQDDQRILVDCGSGHDSGYESLGNLPDSMAEDRVDANSITHVIVTHGHFDHIGGIVNSDMKPAFPNARYMMMRGEWQHWTEDIFRANPDEENNQESILKRQKLNIIENQLDLIEPDTDILPGIKIIATPGHTDHHISLHITSNDQHLIVTSDAIVHPIHIANPTWKPAWNTDYQASERSTQKLLKLASQHNARIFGCHFPPPGLGTVTTTEQGWQWQPVSR